MHDKGIIVTGTSGYLGSSFIKKFNKDTFLNVLEILLTPRSLNFLI